jgi:hypothetical protein
MARGSRLRQKSEARISTCPAEGWRGGEVSVGGPQGARRRSAATGPRSPLWLTLCAAFLLVSCVEVPIDRLFALHLTRPPDARTWSGTLPLSLKSGGGTIHGANARLAELELDTDAVHLGSASCHHGPPITSPVPAAARAFYTDRELFVEVRWDDPTEDRTPLAWSRGPAGWRLGEGDEDGIAILWSRTAGPFGCQEACHMRDFAIRQGELVDSRSMFLVKKEDWEETWIWKPAEGAQALTLGQGGFMTSRGELYRTLNSVAASDPALSPEARRAATFGPGDHPLSDVAGRPLPPGATGAPAYRYAENPDRGGLSAVAERTRRGWRVVFTRAREAGPRRQEFRPGESYHFGVAIFDANSTNHHIARDTKTLQLVVPTAQAPPAAAEPAGIL